MIRVIVITAYNGENEIILNKESVLSQLDVTIVEHLIKGEMSLSESQSWVYAECLKNKRRCDYFLKLDGDMVLKSPYSLRRMIEIAKSANRSTFLVDDFITRSSIIGVHLLPSVCIPSVRQLNEYRHDYWIETIRGNLFYVSYVNHAQLFSKSQQIHFLTQRLGKAIIDGSKSDYWIMVIDCLLSNMIYRGYNDTKLLYKNAVQNIESPKSQVQRGRWGVQEFIYIIVKYVFKKTKKNIYIFLCKSQYICGLGKAN